MQSIIRSTSSPDTMTELRAASNFVKEKDKNDENQLSCDSILREIGGFGPYQIIVGLAMGVSMFLTIFDAFDFVFASAIPEHRLALFTLSLPFSF